MPDTPDYATIPAITQCEAAEICALVAEKVMGWELIKRAKPDLWHFSDTIEDERILVGYSRVAAAWNPAVRMEHAWDVMDHLTKRFHVSVGGQCPGWTCDVSELAGQSLARAVAPTAPLAICRAALLAVGKEQK